MKEFLSHATYYNVSMLQHEWTLRPREIGHSQKGKYCMTHLSDVSEVVKRVEKESEGRWEITQWIEEKLTTCSMTV